MPLKGTYCRPRTRRTGTYGFTQTSIYAEATNVMKAILGYSKACKKYSGEQEEKLKQKIMNIANKVDEVEKKSPEFSDHCRTFREIMQTAFWVFVVIYRRFSLPPSSCSKGLSSLRTSGLSNS